MVRLQLVPVHFPIRLSELKEVLVPSASEGTDLTTGENGFDDVGLYYRS